MLRLHLHLDVCCAGDATLPMLTLQLSDPATSAALVNAATTAAAAAAGTSNIYADPAVAAAVAAAGNGCLQVVLPPPDAAECAAGFVIPHSRFMATMGWSWSVGDRVQV